MPAQWPAVESCTSSKLHGQEDSGVADTSAASRLVFTAHLESARWLSWHRDSNPARKAHNVDGGSLTQQTSCHLSNAIGGAHLGRRANLYLCVSADVRRSPVGVGAAPWRPPSNARDVRRTLSNFVRHDHSATHSAADICRKSCQSSVCLSVFSAMTKDNESYLFPKLQSTARTAGGA